MTEPMSPSTGWGVLHLFCAVPPEIDREAVISAVKGAQGRRPPGRQHSRCWATRPTWGSWRSDPTCGGSEGSRPRCRKPGSTWSTSYVSLTEVSEYAKGMPEEMLSARLYPQLPPEGKPAFCFYPMSKRRGEQFNWYALPFDERKELMMGHGATGRTFAGRVLQVVTGSAGVDDYEWGVSLFAREPRRPQGRRLHDALRRGIVPLRRVRPVLHRPHRVSRRSPRPRLVRRACELSVKTPAKVPRYH